RLIDPFPEIADVVVETDNDRKIAFVIIDSIERGAAAHLVRRFNIERVDVVVGVKDPRSVIEPDHGAIWKHALDVVPHHCKLLRPIEVIEHHKSTAVDKSPEITNLLFGEPHHARL